uniref:Fibronectin type-III domain-containing protein n=1 Tax=Knipowitschia caucasica TaxID=637954 RepID=A0AAV2KEU8_KNICA
MKLAGESNPTAVGRFWVIHVIGSTFYIKGSPVIPSPPECHIPCDGSACDVDIICTWTVSDPDNSLIQTLHWANYNSTATGHTAIIQRNDFTSPSKLQVWVQTQNRDGTVSKSEMVIFYTENLYKSPRPKIVSSSQDPIEIQWRSLCENLGEEQCEVRYRTEIEKAWVQQDEGGVSGSYMLNNAEPSRNYSFQIRCKCGAYLMSDWSEALVIRSAERVPIGKLDIWKDCKKLDKVTDCVLVWKKLPMFEARGHILGYKITLYYNDGSIMDLNEPVAKSKSLICNAVQCFHNSSLMDVKSVVMCAYNALGETEPSHLILQTSVAIAAHKVLDLKMRENNITISWSRTWSTDNMKEFVVQYKEAGTPLGRGLDWVRIDISTKTITIKGKFKKYTAYQVSMFTVANHTTRLYCTDVTHYVQGKPTRVPLFKVDSYGTTNVTLSWKTVLMSVHNGVIPYYQIGFGNNVYNVSGYPQMENRTYVLTNLAEDHDYEVWIKAVNQAGPGPNTTVQFKTLSTDNIGRFICLFLTLFGAVVLLLLVSLLVLAKRKTYPAALSCLFEKVPDPHNSNILKEIGNQIHGFCIPKEHVEQHPKMSTIEVVNSCVFNSKLDHDPCDWADEVEEPEEKEHKTSCGCRKQEYSKMIDSDKEKNEEDTDTCSSSSEEDSAGYEQHFMPTKEDMMELNQQ